MYERKFMEIGRKVMSDDTEIDVTIDIPQAWILVNGLQLLTRHPGISQTMKDIYTHIGRELQSAIVELHPEAEELMQMGWDTKFDVDANGKLANRQ